MTEAYDLRSNIKNKPGAQGTLFQVKDKGLLNPQQRWPQGYTPERLNEVRGALARTPITPPDHLYEVPDREAQQEHGTNVFGYRERVKREIAKTTIPTEHLSGLREISGDPDEDTHGTYWKGGAKDRVVAVDMTARSSDDARKTLTHEIGHHVNMSLSPTPHVHELVAQIHAHKAIEGNEWRDKPTETDVHMAKSKVRSGVDEAQADDYLMEHYRSGGRKPQRAMQGAYEENFTEHDRMSRYPGYNDVRPPENTPDHQRSRAIMQQAQFQPALLPRGMGGVSDTALQRRLAAVRDANSHAVGENLR